MKTAKVKKPAKKKKQVDVFAEAINDLVKDFSVKVLSENSVDDIPYYIPFRHLGLQAITGGVPGGQMTVIEGDSQSGKSFLVYELIVACLAKGGYAFLSDSENALKPRFMRRVGLGSGQRFAMTKDNMLSRNFAMWRKFVLAIRKHDKTSPILIAADSFPAMQIKVAIDELNKEKELGGYMSARKNAELSQLLGEFIGFINKYSVAMVWVNQLRLKIGLMFGDPTTTNADNIFKYYANLRIRGRLNKKIKTNVGKKDLERQIGVKAVWETIKNRDIDPFKKVSTDIIYRDGAIHSSGLFALLLTEGRITKAKAKGKFLYNGKRYPNKKIVAFVKKYPEVLDFKND